MIDIRLLADQRDVTAIVVGNDMLAVGCLRFLRSIGIDCPNDVSVVGMNDMLFMEDIAPALTTMRTPTADLGTQAACILVSMIQGLPVPNENLAETGIVSS